MSTRSSTPSSVSSIRFLDLPPELRQYIYRFVLEDCHESRRISQDAYTDKHTASCQLPRLIGGVDNHEIYMAVPSGPYEFCSNHRQYTSLCRHHLPPLLYLNRSIVGLEAALLYFSMYKLTFAMFWKSTITGGFRALAQVFKIWNLPDCRIIKHITLEFQREMFTWQKESPSRLDDFHILARWTHFFASKDAAMLPKPSAIHCKWADSICYSEWTKASTLVSTWPKLLAGLQALGRQIRVEHKLQDSNLHQSQPHIKAVEKRVRSWINDWKTQDDFSHARRDLLRSWATVAKFTSADGTWIYHPHSSFENADGVAWSQEKWDLYLELPLATEEELQS